MGCNNAKEKIEDQMMKLKMARIELQMERHNQLELLKGIDGKQFKTAPIPDYIDNKFLENYYLNNIKASSKQNNGETLRKINNPKIRSKSLLFRTNNKLINLEEKDKRKTFRKKSVKRKTLKV